MDFGTESEPLILDLAQMPPVMQLVFFRRLVRLLQDLKARPRSAAWRKIRALAREIEGLTAAELTTRNAEGSSQT